MEAQERLADLMLDDLSGPWRTTEVRSVEDPKRIEFHLRYDRGSKFKCSDCGAKDQPVRDTVPRDWDHLRVLRRKSRVYARVPCTACGECGKVRMVEVPWARPNCGFTHAMEQCILELATEMPVLRLSSHLCIGADRAWRVIRHHVDAARAKMDLSQVENVGIDEMSRKRGHNYLTLVHDLDTWRLVFACPGRDSGTIKSFVDSLVAHGGDPACIKIVCIDMNEAYIAGVGERLPDADIVFDKFHIVKLANAAVAKVRLCEVRYEPALKNTRWAWLKTPETRTERHERIFQDLSKRHFATGRGYQLREALRDILNTEIDKGVATELLQAWTEWAEPSRLDPFRKVARTVKEHWDGILNYFSAKVTNAFAEALNGTIQAMKRMARGYRNVENFIAIAFLLKGKLEHLPPSPFEPEPGPAATRA